MFALEELNMHLFPTNTLWQAFVCAALAAVTLQWFNPFGTGKLVLFSVTANQPWKQFELVFWLLLGALGGLLGVALVKLNIKIANIRKKSILKSFPIVETIVVAIVTALLSYSSIITRCAICQIANLSNVYLKSTKFITRLCTLSRMQHRTRHAHICCHL